MHVTCTNELSMPVPTESASTRCYAQLLHLWTLFPRNAYISTGECLCISTSLWAQLIATTKVTCGITDITEINITTYRNAVMQKKGQSNPGFLTHIRKSSEWDLLCDNVTIGISGCTMECVCSAYNYNKSLMHSPWFQTLSNRIQFTPSKLQGP